MIEQNAPKIVMDCVETIVSALRESLFFEDYEITEDYSIKLFTELITEEYIKNPSLDDTEFFWTEEEFEVILEKVITGSILYELKNDGILNSYEDDNTEETFFLTEKGKELSKTLKTDIK